MSLNKREKKIFMEAAKNVFNATYDRNKSPYSCHAFIELINCSDMHLTVRDRYKQYLYGNDSYGRGALYKNRKYVNEAATDNFTWGDGFDCLTPEQRQLARSLMILMVMEAESVNPSV